MIRAFVLYETAPEPERYAEHVELCRAVPGAEAFRHGPVFGSPMGEAPYAYYAEFEFADKDAFKAATRAPEFAATAKDAMDMGIPFQVMFANVS